MAAWWLIVFLALLGMALAAAFGALMAEGPICAPVLAALPC